MCASWNNAEIKIEKVSEREVSLQIERAVREECDKAIRDMKKAVNSCVVKEGQTILEYINQSENAINDICYSFRKVMMAFADSESCSSVIEGLYLEICRNTRGTPIGKSFFKLAKDCTEELNGWIEEMLVFNPDEKYFKKEIERCRYLIGESKENNNNNIFLEFANSIVWIGENSACKFAGWFGEDCKREIFEKIGHRVSTEYESPREYSDDIKGIINKAIVGVGTLFLENEDSVLPSTMQKIDGWEEVVKRRFTRADVTKDMQDRKEINALMKKTI